MVVPHGGKINPDAPYFSNLLCLRPEDFNRQVKSAATRSMVNKYHFPKYTIHGDHYIPRPRLLLDVLYLVYWGLF